MRKTARPDGSAAFGQQRPSCGRFGRSACWATAQHSGDEAGRYEEATKRHGSDVRTQRHRRSIRPRPCGAKCRGPPQRRRSRRASPAALAAPATHPAPPSKACRLPAPRRHKRPAMQRNARTRPPRNAATLGRRRRKPNSTRHSAPPPRFRCVRPAGRGAADAKTGRVRRSDATRARPERENPGARGGRGFAGRLSGGRIALKRYAFAVEPCSGSASIKK